MTTEEILREIAALPPEGRSLLENFIGFMRQRYARQGAPSPNTPHANENFIGMWRDRDEITDSTTCVRSLRASEWGQ